MPVQGVIGPGATSPSNGLIGGVTIGGGHTPMNPGTVGGGGNKSDIALLQSLLPGVHITSGGNYGQGSNFGTIGGSGSNDWNSAPGSNQQQQRPGTSHLHMAGGPPPQQWNGGLQSSLGGHPVGAIGQSANKPQRQAPGSIW